MKYNFDKVIDRYGTYCTQWDFCEDRFGDKNILPFSISDTDFQSPTEIVNELNRSVQHGVFGYTRWDHDAYKNAIVKHFSIRWGTKIFENDIVYSPSVLYSISALIEILTEKEDGILTFDPMYEAFGKVIVQNDRVLVTSCLDNDNQYKIDFDDLEEKLKLSKVMILCSPHNPTGKVFSEYEMKRIVAICQKYEIWIISDEIHADILLFNSKFTSLMDYANEYQRLIVVSSASKTFNTPGLGGSYAIIPSMSVKEKFRHKTKQKDFVNSASIMGTLSLIIGYNECNEYVDELVKYIEENMMLLENFVKTEFSKIQFHRPEATYLAWIDVRRLNYTSEEIQQALVKVGRVGFMSGEKYGENGKGYLRINLGCPRSKLVRGLEGFKQAIDFLGGE